MEPEKRRLRSWWAQSRKVGRAVVPYGFAAAGIALGVGGIVQNEPIAGACGAVAGVTAGLLQHRRARFHRDHVDALRERLRVHRLESEQALAQLRQTVSSLQTELWQHRMVALATPAFGIQMNAIKGTLPHATPAPTKPAPTTPVPTPTGIPIVTAEGVDPSAPKNRGPEPFAQAS
jgi:hypothetical protein